MEMYTSIHSNKSVKGINHIVFSLHSDFFKSEHIRKITKYVKELGYDIKKNRTYSKKHLMSWCNVTITVPFEVSWNINEAEALKIINNALILRSSKK